MFSLDGHCLCYGVESILSCCMMWMCSIWYLLPSDSTMCFLYSKEWQIQDVSQMMAMVRWQGLPMCLPMSL